MKKLVDGIHRFQSGVFGEQKDLFARLCKGQEPDALFITCSQLLRAYFLIAFV